MNRNRNNPRTWTSIAAAVIAMTSGSAWGATTVYNTESAFVAAHPGTTMFSFETGWTPAPTVDFGDFTIFYSYSYPSRSSSYATDGSYVAGITGDGSSYATFTFDRPTQRFGINILEYGTFGTPSSLQLTTNAGDSFTLASASTPLAWDNVIERGIYNSSTPFTQVSIRTTGAGDYISFDEVRYQLAPGGGNWLNTTNVNNTWSRGANWTTGYAPGANVGNDAVFNAGTTYDVAFTADANARLVNINRGNVGFLLNGRTLTASDLLVSRSTSGDTTLRIGDGTAAGNGIVNITGTGTQYVGISTFHGALFVNNATLNLPNADRLTVGDSSEGYVQVIGGGVLTAGKQLFVADNPGSVSTLIVSGTGSRLAVGVVLAVGAGGNTNGTINVEDGGLIQSPNINLGFSGATGAVANLNVSGATSRVEAGALNFGTGTPGINEAATLTLTSGTVAVSGATAISNTASRINLIGGILRTRDLIANQQPSQFFWTGGTLELTGGTASFFRNTLEVPLDGGLSGTGSILMTNGGGSPSTLENRGRLQPGSPGGTLYAGGNFSNFGTYAVDLSDPVTIGMLSVSNTATLGGTLDVSTLNGYTPDYGARWRILMAQNIVGQFATFDPQLSPTRFAIPIYGSSYVDIAIALPGDGDLNGMVDFDDLLLVAQNYNQPNRTWITGDFDGTGVVDFEDLLSLAQNYGASLLGVSTEANFEADWALARSLVPEPSTLILLAATVPFALSRRRVGEIQNCRPRAFSLEPRQSLKFV